MRRIVCLLCLFVAAAFALGQGHRKPVHTDTYLKLDVAGRGTVTIQLFAEEAPKTTAQIVRLVRAGFYNGLRFHRVEKTPKPYLVQVGDPSSRDGSLDDPKMGFGGSGTSVPYEDSGHQNIEGAVGLVRTAENQDSGDSQFYMLLGTSKFLDGHYTVFGQVVSGMDVVQKIERGDRITSATLSATP
jgi:cyclophilin family peptidyl-prolyl cis-trans isomerase